MANTGSKVLFIVGRSRVFRASENRLVRIGDAASRRESSFVVRRGDSALVGKERDTEKGNDRKYASRNKSKS